jgi:thiamine-phosphate pyrophosphorylase
LNKASIDYRLYLVTDRMALRGRALLPCVEAAINGGVTLVQLREKEMSTAAFYELAVQLKALCHKYRIPFLVNDRLDIALAVDADGVHIGQTDMPLEQARKLLGPDKLIGVSVFTREEALLAQAMGADYLGVGAVFPTPSKADAHFVSLGELAKIKAAVTLPVIAIGGITAANVQQAARSVDGVAVISAILAQEDCQQAAAGLLRKIPVHK